MRGEEKGEASKRTQDKTREEKIRPEMRSYILIFFPMYSMKRQVFRRYSSSFGQTRLEQTLVMIRQDNARQYKVTLFRARLDSKREEKANKTS